MSAFDTLAGGAADVIRDFYGETVTLTRGAVSASVKALVETISNSTRALAAELVVEEASLRVSIRVSDLTAFSGELKRGDSVTRGGKTYYVLATSGDGLYSEGSLGRPEGIDV